MYVFPFPCIFHFVYSSCPLNFVFSKPEGRPSLSDYCTCVLFVALGQRNVKTTQTHCAEAEDVWGEYVALQTHNIVMKWRCDHRSCDCDLSNREVSPKNVLGASRGFEPMASALALQCSTDWAMKTHTLGAGQFVEFILPVRGMRHMNIMWTADIRVKWRCAAYFAIA